MVGESTRFKAGNQAAAKQSKREIAEQIRLRLTNDADTLSAAQFTTLVSKYDRLTLKRRIRSRKESPAEENRSASFADHLSGQEAEDHRMILQIESERLEAGRKKWNKEHPAKQKEQTPLESVEVVSPAAPSGTRWSLKADV